MNSPLWTFRRAEQPRRSRLTCACCRRRPYTSDDSYYAVNCIDKPFARTNRNWVTTATKWEKESPTFGRYQAASDLLTCPTWPTRNPDRWIGPWNRKTKNPIVVVGNYYDPATQYMFSQRMAKQLGNARLISVDAFGHCILGDSAGADAAVTEVPGRPHGAG